jgi:predicted HicB family RNase H-like nuclease
MADSVEDYLELCQAAGKEAERPYRGEFLIRTTPEVHRVVATAAEAQGMSLNAWVETAISEVASQRRPSTVLGAKPRKPASKRRKARTPRGS